MDQSKVAGIREHQLDGGGKEGNQGTALSGGDWLRISYERRDGRVQVQYILFGPGGYVHSFIDGTISAEAECWHNDVYETQRVDYGINRVSVVSRTGWNVWRMVGEVDAERAGRLVDGNRYVD